MSTKEKDDDLDGDQQDLPRPVCNSRSHKVIVHIGNSFCFHRVQKWKNKSSGPLVFSVQILLIFRDITDENELHLI